MDEDGQRTEGDEDEGRGADGIGECGLGGGCDLVAEYGPFGRSDGPVRYVFGHRFRAISSWRLCTLAGEKGYYLVKKTGVIGSLFF